MRQRNGDDTGVSEMKAFGAELLATGTRYLRAGQRWLEARADDAARSRHAEEAPPARRRASTRAYAGTSSRGDDDHGAWSGGRPSPGAENAPGRGEWAADADRDDHDPGSTRSARRHDHDGARGQPRSQRVGAGAGSPYAARQGRDGLREDDLHVGHGRARSDRDDDAPRDTGWRGIGPQGYTRSDARIAEDVCERLMHDDAIDARGITVAVRDGAVTLDGHVPRRAIKHRVEDLVDQVAGVRDIENRLRVRRDGIDDAGPGRTPAHEGAPSLAATTPGTVSPGAAQAQTPASDGTPTAPSTAASAPKPP